MNFLDDGVVGDDEAVEQSGVGHSITFLSPLTVKEIFQHGEHWGWAVEGSPADCVKLALAEFCPRRPDLVVSGVNGGLNAGINVLYSGTVAAAIEGAFFEITSVAVSLEFNEHADYDKAARLACRVIEQILARKGPQPQLYNLNIPTAALERLCRTYWFPLYAFVRRQGHDVPEAQDLTQGFFELFLAKHYLKDVDRDKGRFRSFLLASLKHFLANEWKKANRQKRGGRVEIISFDAADAEERYQLEAVDTASAELIYDRRWARAV